MYYYFSPLMKDGKQEVRPARAGEWVEDVGSVWYVEGDTIDRYSIMSLHRFEKDPFGPIRDTLKEIKDDLEGDAYPLCPKKMWAAITETMKILEEGKP